MAPSRLAGLAGTATLVALATPAAAGLLDEPPRVLSYRLGDAGSLSLLRPFQDAATEQLGPTRVYLQSRWGRWADEPSMRLSWFAEEPTQPPGADDRADDEQALRFEPEAPPSWLRWLSPDVALASTGPSLVSDGWGGVFATPEPPPKPWICRRWPVTFVRYGGESGRFPLVGCDGAVAPGALDKLSILARPPEAARPGDELPDEPDPDAWSADREWVPGVRMMNPRLLWALQRLADAFPRRVVYVYSGYRPHATVDKKPGGHESLHARGRAMDIQIYGIPNDELFKVCRTLDDVGCGYYPHSKFVHVDVRRPRTGHAFWIDASSPGEPSHYVDSWPGVVERGALAWDPRRAAEQATCEPDGR